MSKRPLAALRIGNFKAFGETQTIPIKPITLIFGPNSAGKSSIIHSLALAHETNLNPNTLDVHRTDIGGTAIDLGGFRQFVHQRQANRRVEWGAELNVSQLSEEFRESMGGFSTLSISALVGITQDDVGQAVDQTDPAVESLEICADGEEILRMSSRGIDEYGSSIMRIDRINSSGRFYQHLVKRYLKYDHEGVEHIEGATTEDLISEDLIAAALPNLTISISGLFKFSIDTDFFHESVLRDANALVGCEDARQIHINIDANSFWSFFGTKLNELARELSTVLRSCVYLGPIRALPPRNIDAGNNKDVDWQPGGGSAWDAVRRSESLRNAVNSWLGSDKLQTRYRLVAKDYVALGDIRGHLFGAFYEQPKYPLVTRELLEKDLEVARKKVEEYYAKDKVLSAKVMAALEPWLPKIKRAKSNQRREEIIEEALESIRGAENLIEDTDPDGWDDHFAESAAEEVAFDKTEALLGRIDKSSIDKETKLILHDISTKTDVSHRDVGIGISQVLPVLVAAFGSARKLIAMEQPEIHLHPALQAELADVFIRSAKGPHHNTFILETHSEHLILRIMRRIRETAEGKETGLPPITNKDVSILYVEPVGTRSIVREMPLNEMGELVKAWPGGFFEEGLREQFGDA